MKKKTILFLVIGLVIALLVALPFLKRKNDIKPEYVTSNIKMQDVTNEITATGTLNPLQIVDVGTQVSGIVSKLYVDFNDMVKQGQIIATIDTLNLSLAIVDAEANLVKAKAQFTQQKQEHARYEDLLEKKAVSQSDFDLVKANYLVAESILKSAQANLKRAKTNIAYATITAPISGIIINRNVNEGQTVAANFSAPVLFTIANDLKKMELQARIDEADIGKVQIGQPVHFNVDAYPDVKFTGEVQQIRLQPTTTQNVVTYTVIINAPNPDLKLLPGMNANISIVINEHKNVLTVPLSAFAVRTENDSTAQKGVFKIYTLSANDSLVPIIVNKGIDDGNICEISGSSIKKDLKVVIGVKDVETKQIKSFLPTPSKNKNQLMRPH